MTHKIDPYILEDMKEYGLAPRNRCGHIIEIIVYTTMAALILCVVWLTYFVAEDYFCKDNARQMEIS